LRFSVLKTPKIFRSCSRSVNFRKDRDHGSVKFSAYTVRLRQSRKCRFFRISIVARGLFADSSPSDHSGRETFDSATQRPKNISLNASSSSRKTKTFRKSDKPPRLRRAKLRTRARRRRTSVVARLLCADVIRCRSKLFLPGHARTRRISNGARRRNGNGAAGKSRITDSVP